MTWTAPAAFGLFLLGAALGLTQLWLAPFAHETFVKLLITLGVLFAVLIAWHLFQRERHDTARLKNRTTLD